jgi:ABC-type bacteriocin/lantibiotic exporter with double-glycine peptidase domain
LLRLVQQTVAPNNSLISVWTRLEMVLMSRMGLVEVFKKPPDLPAENGQLGLLEN